MKVRCFLYSMLTLALLSAGTDAENIALSFFTVLC